MIYSVFQVNLDQCPCQWSRCCLPPKAASSLQLQEGKVSRNRTRFLQCTGTSVSMSYFLQRANSSTYTWWKLTVPKTVCLCGNYFLPGLLRTFSLASTGCGALHRYLSNEGISAITEEELDGEGEEPHFPLPYRGHPLVRGVDHIRGSQCFVNAVLHSSATIPYQEAAASKKASAAACPSPSYPPGAAAAPPTALSKQSTSLLGGWLARLRLLSH